MLIVDCCPRGKESRTRKFYEAYLAKTGKKDVEIIYIAENTLEPLNEKTLSERDLLIARGDFSNEEFRHAKKFRDADEILIAAPYWDLSFPSALKVYVEHLTVAGLTFRYNEDGRSVGLCRAKKLLYFTTMGGFTDKNLGYEYIKSLAGLFGIDETEEYRIEGLDIDPSKADALLSDAVAKL